MNTSQPNHNPDGSDDLDILLGTAYTRLVNDLTATLDLDAGAAQATHPATYSALTHDLAQQLDLDAGLAAIVTGGSLPPPNDPQPHQPASPHPAMDQAQDLEHLRFLDAPTRLALRADPAFRSLRDALELAEFIARARDLAEQGDLPRALALDLDRALDRDRDRALDRDRDRDRALAHSISDAFQLALAVALGLTHHVASGYGRILGLRLDLGQGDRLDQSAVTRARMALAEVGDDFVGADLRSAQLHPDVSLVGVERHPMAIGVGGLRARRLRRDQARPLRDHPHRRQAQSDLCSDVTEKSRDGPGLPSGNHSCCTRRTPASAPITQPSGDPVTSRKRGCLHW